MIILFGNKKLRKTCNEANLNRKQPRQRLLGRRLDELRAAETLADLRDLPGPRCHELKGNLKGKLSVDLDGPYRLIFEPADDPIPKKEDGGLEWSKVQSIRILVIKDTHD